MCRDTLSLLQYDIFVHDVWSKVNINAYHYFGKKNLSFSNFLMLCHDVVVSKVSIWFFVSLLLFLKSFVVCYMWELIKLNLLFVRAHVSIVTKPICARFFFITLDWELKVCLCDVFFRAFDSKLKLCLCEVSSKTIISEGINVLLSSRLYNWCSVFVKFVWKHLKFESFQLKGSFYIFIVKVLWSYWEYVHFYYQNYTIKTLLENNHLGRSLGDFVVRALWSKLCLCEVSLRAFKASIILEGVCALFW
jgi:hypothetical protein